MQHQTLVHAREADAEELLGAADPLGAISSRERLDRPVGILEAEGGRPEDGKRLGGAHHGRRGDREHPHALTVAKLLSTSARGSGSDTMERMKRVLLLALLLAGCGAPSADLFVVKRSGADRNADLTLLVSDDGTVTCNGHKHEISNQQLLDARGLTRDLSKQAQLNLSLPPRPGSVLSYRVRMEAGTVAFSDTSRPLPVAFTKLEQFTKDVSEDVCGIHRG